MFGNSKEYILRTFNQATIFATYISLYTEVELSSEDVVYLASKNKKISSPLRTDENPSVGFKYTKPNLDATATTDFDRHGKLKMRDFTAPYPNVGSRFWGDCFDFVAYILKKNVNDPLDFQDIINHIYETLNGNYDRNIKIDRIAIDSSPIKTTIEFSTRPWTKTDLAIWSKYTFTKQELETDYIYPVNEYWLHFNPKPSYRYHSSDPCYAYTLGTDSDGIDKVQLYHPLRNKRDNLPRFISNVKGIVGMHNVIGRKVFILTKNYKTVLMFKKLIYLLSFTGLIKLSLKDCSIAYMSSETVYLNDKQGNFITKNFDTVFIHGDWDRTGKLFMKHHRDKYGFKPFATKEYASDIAEYVAAYGLEAGKEFLLNYLTNCK